MDLNAEILKLLEEIVPGQISSTAYDTAWVARLIDQDSVLSNKALGWLTEHQLPDGSWGAAEPFYYHDRVISTLSAMIALTHRGRRAQDKVQIENGLFALEQITSGATGGLAADPNGATVGFEMIIPTLVAEAEQLGIIKQQGDRILGRLSRLREAKIERIKNIKISREISTIFSCEMAGDDKLHILNMENLQENNGSIGSSPSATSYFLLKIDPGNEHALEYIRRSTNNGSASFASPYNIFERAWVLWNIGICDIVDDGIKGACSSHLETLEKHWRPLQGVSFSSNFGPCDGDDTSVAYGALAQFGIYKDIETLLSYEQEEHFRCYDFEANPSIGANTHMLSALKYAGFEGDHPAIQKILNFLRTNQQFDAYWVDKWHISPFYMTAHIVLACIGYDDQLCDDAIEWILNSQKPNGSWGFYTFSTAEETAYCIQALAIWEQHTGKVPASRIEMGLNWLRENMDPPYPPLWISKATYSPELIIKSTILCALALGEKLSL